ncbi:MAG: hypothetical protein ACOX45_07405 [Acutalibacteraceae bacterium]
MTRDFEFELLKLNEKYLKTYKASDKKLNIYLSAILALVFLTGFSVKIAIYYRFFIILSVLFGAAVVFIAFFALKCKENFDQSISDYHANCSALREEAYAANIRIVSSLETTEKFGINIITILFMTVMSCVLIGSFSNIQKFTLKKWVDNKALRPFMIEDFGHCQRSISYDETRGNKQKYPDLLRSYTRDELTEIFSSDKKNDVNKDIIISYSDTYNGDFMLDTHYSFSDPLGKDYWVLIFHLRRNGTYMVATRVEIMPSGTKVELSEYSFEFL